MKKKITLKDVEMDHWGNLQIKKLEDSTCSSHRKMNRQIKVTNKRGSLEYHMEQYKKQKAKLDKQLSNFNEIEQIRDFFS